MSPPPAIAFDFDTAPFDALTPPERVRARREVRVERFEPEATLLAAEAAPAQAYLIATGHVEHSGPGASPAVHGPGALIAVRELLAGRAGGRWVALDEVTAHAVPRSLLLDLVGSNAAFAARLFGQIARRLVDVAQRQQQRELLSLMMVRIGDAYLRQPVFVDGALDLISVCRELSAQGLTNALVRDGDRIGMFTTTDLRDALLRDVPPSALAVREVARFDLIAVHPDSELFDALLTMVRHRVHRVLVRDGDHILGVLSQLDLMSFVANHSHIIAIKVEQAASIAELREAALQMDDLVVLLQDSGVKVAVITSLVSELNGRIFARLWAFIAPPALVDNSCLVVMGSEGRGEQILKTDQDNALLLRDGFELEGIEDVARRFNAALADFGYPPCPGDIMLTNPLWRQPMATFRETLRGWVYGADPLGVMHLAIFFDAVAVAGDASLLQQARDHLDAILADNDALLARFARAIEQFSEPGNWWTWLTSRRDEQPLDLKKLGTFPLVHGVRALALQYRVRAPGTAQRLRALADQGHLDAAFARDLLETLHFLMGLRLRHQLRQRELGQAAGNLVLPSALGTLERERLSDALGIVKKFRQHLQHHFRLDAL